MGGLDGLYAETYGYDANSGNLNLKSGLSYSYLDNTHKHAVTNTSDGAVYTYDANGNQISRLKGGITTTFTYDAENKLTLVNIGGTPTASFEYDGDGTRVASTINGVTTRFVGEYFEVTGEVVTKYYGGKTSMRKGTVLTYLLADHLGSNSLITSDNGTLLSKTRYKPWGEIRYSTGTTTTPYTYTGQYSNNADFGWMYYKARWFDPSLGRFSQADTIIPRPSNIRSWDRYSYSANNPIRYLDPTGHDWLNSVGGFIQGFIAEVDRSFFGLTPQLQEFYGPDDNETDAVLIGRMTADILEMVGGVAAIGSGLGVGGGGVLACGTGVGCLATPETIVAGIAIIGVGSKAVAEGALGLGQNLAYLEKSGRNTNNEISPLKGKEATEAAKKLGFTRRIPSQKAGFNSHGQPVFFNPKTNTYITPDIDGHNGGVWKMFDGKYNRLGTFDSKLNQIGE